MNCCPNFDLFLRLFAAILSRQRWPYLLDSIMYMQKDWPKIWLEQQSLFGRTERV